MLKANSSGQWQFEALYGFTGSNDGLEPVGGMIRDQSGNLYGTTFGGGEYYSGVVYEITQ